jgi:hypothetical protein
MTEPNPRAEFWDGIRPVLRYMDAGVSAQRWDVEHSARDAPIGIVLYDDDDDLFTVKTKDGEWVVYSRDRYEPLRDADIDGDRGDQIVGQLEGP